MSPLTTTDEDDAAKKRADEIRLSDTGHFAVCPLCGNTGSVEGLKANLDGGLRSKALVLSGWIVGILLVAHIVFAYDGKVLPIPDFVWMMIAVPWVGESASKISDLVDYLRTIKIEKK